MMVALKLLFPFNCGMKPPLVRCPSIRATIVNGALVALHTGMARWVGGQQRWEEKRHKPLHFFERASKGLRSSFEASRYQHACSRLGVGWARRRRTVRGMGEAVLRRIRVID